MEGATLVLATDFMPLRTILSCAHRALQCFKSVADRENNSRYRLTACRIGRHLEILEPRLMLTGSAPEAVDDFYVTHEESAIIITVLENDRSFDEAISLQIFEFEQAENGNVFANTDGTLTYAPANGFLGQDQFTYVVTDGSGRFDSASVTLEVIPAYYLNLVDFGVTAERNMFGVAEWDVIIQDKYATHTDIGPGGLFQIGGSAVYNYQGITGPARNFYAGERIIASWYNNGDVAITFTPQLSLEDTNRRISNPGGTWYAMESITLEPGSSGTTMFTIDDSISGVYGVVNVNSNAGSSSLIIDKIGLSPVRVRSNLVDFGTGPTDDIFNVSGWETVIKDVYARRTESGRGGIYQFGGSAQYNYQGVTGSLKTFLPGEELLATYFNNGESPLTFTPLISFDDPNRKQSSPDGTWHPMKPLTIGAGQSGVTTFTVGALMAGDYDLVNINSNVSSDALIFDKLEINGIIVPPYNAVPEVTWRVLPENGSDPLTILVDATGTFDPDGTIVEYRWDWGDGSYDLGIATHHTYEEPGNYTLKLTVTDNGGVAAERVVDTKQINVYDPEKIELLVEFGNTPEESQFGWADWKTIIKDRYADYSTAGPGGIYQRGGNANYNFQGVAGATAKDFLVGQKIRVTWYNNSTSDAATLTPRISFDDMDRNISGMEGTWHQMSSVTVEPLSSAVSEYTFDATSAGKHDLVSINSNYRDIEQVLIADKIELVRPNLSEVAARNHLTTAIDTSLPITIEGNTATLRSLPEHGSLSGDIRSGTVTYTPDAGFQGLDHFAYQLTESKELIAVYVTVGSEVNIPLLPQKWVQSTYNRPIGGVHEVRNTGDPLQNGIAFQAALDNAQGGEVIVLDAGATYAGSFTLRKKPGNEWIYVESSDLDQLPTAGNRVAPEDAMHMPTLEVTSDWLPVIQAEAGAHHYRFTGIKFFTEKKNGSGLVQLGYDNGERADRLEKMNHHIIFDRVYITGTESNHLRHGIVLEGMHMAVVDSHIDQIKDDGLGDAQAIIVTNSPGPFKIVNNRLEATGENFISGGQEPRIEGLVPSDFEFRGNYFFKPDVWNKYSPDYNGYDWSVKNLFELKNAQRVLLEGNTFENSWADAQIGYAILLTPTIQGSAATWTSVKDVTIRGNIVTDARVFISMSGARNADAPAFPQQLERVTVKNNLVTDVSYRMIELNANSAGPIIDLSITHNTLLFAPNILGNAMIATDGKSVPWPVVERFEIKDNIMSHSKYGHHISRNTPIVDTYIGVFDWRHNVIIGGSRNVPESNYNPFEYLIVESLDEVGFVDWQNGDFRLSGSSNFLGLATDGQDIGADRAF